MDKDSNKMDLRKLMFSIATLEDLGKVISSTEEFDLRIKTALFSIMGSLPVSRGGILLFQKIQDASSLELVASRGVDFEGRLSLPLPESVRKGIVKDSKIFFRKHPPEFICRYLDSHSLIFDRLSAYLFLPLVLNGDFLGLVVLGRKFNHEAYTNADLELLEIMANYTAIGLHNQNLVVDLEKSNVALRRKVIENSRLYSDLQKIYNDTVRALSAAIDAKDPYTRGHSDRVASFSVAIAQKMGLNNEEINSLKLASYLHDIGKIAIDNSILCKPAKLDDQEYEIIIRHPLVSYDILSNIDFPYRDVALLTKHHHERINGSGYPDGRKGDELTVGMKILALADAFDAMTSDRPYRPALSVGAALEEILRFMDIQFDQRVIGNFLAVLKEEVKGNGHKEGILISAGKDIRREKLDSLLDQMIIGLGGMTTA